MEFEANGFGRMDTHTVVEGHIDNTISHYCASFNEPCWVAGAGALFAFSIPAAIDPYDHRSKLLGRLILPAIEYLLGNHYIQEKAIFSSSWILLRRYIRI